MSRFPFFFVHIPKTGGTSLINLLRAFTPPGQAYTEDNNNLSQNFTARLASAGLSGAALIHGHPGWGACLPFRGKAGFLTLLREPRSQIISHYLHALRDPAMAQHAAARSLGFKSFLRTYPYNIAYQTNCLYLAITASAEERRRALDDPAYGSALHLERYFASQLAAVYTFLEEMLLVGTLETADQFLTCLTELAGWNHIPCLPHDNAAPEPRAETGNLLDQLLELELEPELAPLFAIERAAYVRAGSLTRAAWLRHFRETMRMGPSRQGGKPLVVHRSPLGEINLGANFEPARSSTTWWEDAVLPQAAWWTRARQLSRIYVRRTDGAPCRLILHADQLHGVKPEEVALCRGAFWQPLAVQPKENGSCIFSTLLDGPAGHDGEYEELSLYLEWNRYPESAPFYPCLRFTSLSLQPG